MLVIVLFDIQQVNYPIYTLFISGGVVACLLEYNYFVCNGETVPSTLVGL